MPDHASSNLNEFFHTCAGVAVAIGKYIKNPLDIQKIILIVMFSALSSAKSIVANHLTQMPQIVFERNSLSEMLRP